MNYHSRVEKVHLNSDSKMDHKVLEHKIDHLHKDTSSKIEQRMEHKKLDRVDIRVERMERVNRLDHVDRVERVDRLDNNKVDHRMDKDLRTRMDSRMTHSVDHEMVHRIEKRIEHRSTDHRIDHRLDHHHGDKVENNKIISDHKIIRKVSRTFLHDDSSCMYTRNVILYCWFVENVRQVPINRCHCTFFNFQILPVFNFRE